MRKVSLLLMAACLLAAIPSHGSRASIHGVVTKDIDGTPIYHVSVQAYDEFRQIAGETVTDENGSYVLPMQAGSYRLWFGGVCCDDYYTGEWFENAARFEEATEVALHHGGMHRIDAALALRPRAVISIDAASVRDEGVLGAQVPGNIGWDRTIDVQVGNHGDAVGDGWLAIWAQSKRDERYQWIARMRFALEAGDSFEMSVPWRGAGTLGDVTIHVEACRWFDYSVVREFSYFATAPGLGDGIRPVASSGWEPAIDECSYDREL